MEFDDATRGPERQLIFDQQEFRCRDCHYERTLGHHRSECPRCGGEVEGPLAGTDARLVSSEWG